MGAARQDSSHRRISLLTKTQQISVDAPKRSRIYFGCFLSLSPPPAAIRLSCVGLFVICTLSPRSPLRAPHGSLTRILQQNRPLLDRQP